jgi:bifunctional N-acetylglucosamine-1-phosphate-uridyltransferase/glucosamine-1-phosphate-acetyltransferase GlmU-like protein
MTVAVADYIARWSAFPLPALAPWVATTGAPDFIAALIPDLGPDWRLTGDAAVHATASVEPGATIKGPAIVGPRCFVSGSALLRGGVFLDEDCIVGPACELKTSFMFRGSKVAHLSFVGDSILGSDVNVEAGAVLANYRNELSDKRIRIRLDGRVIDTGVDKFGALVGDGARIGANAVIAPGAILAKAARVPRLGLVDQHPQAER